MSNEHSFITPFTLSDTCQTTSKGKRTISQFYTDMTEPLHVIGSLFRACCPDAFQEYEDIYMRAIDRGGTGDISVSDQPVFCTMAILRNCQVDPHKDAGDIKNGWVAMLCTGEFEGGLLVLPELGIKLNYRPGDVVFMRSSLVEHFISDYCGQRTSMVFFTKGTAKNWLQAEPEQEVQPWLRLRMERKLYEFEMAEKRAQKPVKTEHFKPHDKRAKP